MNDPAMLRRYVREVLGFAPARKLSERVIFDGVKRLARDPLHVDELKAALAWNEARGYIAFEADEEAAMPGEEAPRLWFLSAEGKKKEGLA